MKYLHIPAALLFLLMAVIQLNDPDPLYWFSVYLASAGVAVVQFLGKESLAYFYLTLGMLLAGLLMSFPGTLDYLSAGDFTSITGKMSGEKPYIESVREFIGLLIVVAYFVVIGRKPKHDKPV